MYLLIFFLSGFKVCRCSYVEGSSSRLFRLRKRFEIHLRSGFLAGCIFYATEVRPLEGIGSESRFRPPQPFISKKNGP
ncbi:hypothetical protein K443DRAFT_245515 [Laccaria amethystina LaAM-08-1]|uniref:Unplaced genomic scaffold K443scaffold_159, whole genome shotgun sequence n=1 Tax=Laccaria amethystina LaAM-08-1 TaxID=1095629 RepID=A0A0C9WLN7_9AGAR|nr:hypothetical protein K443DRAFT_245515 [Laccaria amethystina LaAM-08-1]